MIKPKSTPKSRVVAFMNAISHLHQGDLFAVLELDRWDWDYFTLEYEGWVIQPAMRPPDSPPPPTTVKQMVLTGQQLALFLEQQLMQYLTLGEGHLLSYQKCFELGGRGF